jgi:hypothetical protein
MYLSALSAWGSDFRPSACNEAFAGGGAGHTQKLLFRGDCASLIHIKDQAGADRHIRKV